MIGRMVALTALIALAGCAGLESAGRNATRAPAPPPPAAESAPAPAPLGAPVAAPNVSVPTPAPRRTAENAEDPDVVVRGQVRSQVPPPAGDPRNRIERREDIRAWDQCVSRAQATFETDPMSPQLDTPEDVCRNSLGMASRNAVPESRRR